MNLIRQFLQFIQKHKPHLRDHHGRKSYSQCGEDMIVDYVFRLRGIHQPSYFDIGANHPFFISNTAMFYERGCRGINIEANPQLIPNFQKYRPEDTNLNVGVSDRAGELEFYIMEDNTLSTFSKKERDFMVSNGKKQAAVAKIRLTTVSDVLANHFNDKCPDFLSLDAEGMDFGILQSINFQKYSPKIICVEAAEYSPIGAGTRRDELINYLLANGYFEYANTNLNAIMVKKQFWEVFPG
jgi:FkbM family methyltransferase